MLPHSSTKHPPFPLEQAIRTSRSRLAHGWHKRRGGRSPVQRFAVSTFGMSFAWAGNMSSERSLLSAQRRTHLLSLLLGSIATGSGAACNWTTPLDGDGPGTGGAAGSFGTDGDGPPTGGGGGGTGGAPVVNAPVVATHQLCDGAASLIDGLDLAVEVDSISEYHGRTDHICNAPDYELTSQIGTPCASAAEEAACLDEIERLRAGSADWGKYEDFWNASFGLLVVTGSEAAIAELGGPVETLTGAECGTWGRGAIPAKEPDDSGAPGSGGDSGAAGPYYGEPNEGLGGQGGASAPSSNHVTTVADRETLLALVGAINTASEAALVFWANDFSAPCSVEELEGGIYQMATTEQVNDCPVTEQDYRVQVSAQGGVAWTPVGSPRESDVCVGRRPHGLAAAGASTGDCQLDVDAQWLADVARLEAAAVVAFAQIACMLERAGAPAELVERAHQAAQDEMRHARGVQELASRRGASPKAATVQLTRDRDVLSFAVENAVEGCVRECWGALIAHHQASAAQDADVRALWQQIAEEESAHALLSMDIGIWLSGRLTPGERDVVEAARQRAIADLFAELASDEPARPALGLPDRATRLSLMRTLEARVLRPLAA